MKQNMLAIGLLISSLVVMPGCEWPKTSTCKQCPPTEESSATVSRSSAISPDDTSQPLLLIDGEPRVTVKGFEEFWSDYLQSDPRVAAYAAFMPNIRHEVFKSSLVLGAVIEEWAKRSGKENESEYQQKLRKARQLTDRAIAMQAFEEAVLSEIDTSDATLKKFYETEKTISKMMQQPPFVSQAAGTKAISVEFDNEDAANDFAQKVKDINGDMSTAAQQADKEVVELGVVTGQSRSVDPVLRDKVVSMDAGQIEVVPTSADSFVVVKALEKQEAEYADFADVASAVKQVVMQEKGTKLFEKKIEELKNKYNVVENTEFFEKESEQKKTEQEAQFASLYDQADDKDQSEDEPAASGNQAQSA